MGLLDDLRRHGVVREVERDELLLQEDVVQKRYETQKEVRPNVKRTANDW